MKTNISVITVLCFISQGMVATHCEEMRTFVNERKDRLEKTIAFIEGKDVTLPRHKIGIELTLEQRIYQLRFQYNEIMKALSKLDKGERISPTMLNTDEEHCELILEDIKRTWAEVLAAEFKRNYVAPKKVAKPEDEEDDAFDLYGWRLQSLPIMASMSQFFSLANA